MNLKEEFLLGHFTYSTSTHHKFTKFYEEKIGIKNITRSKNVKASIQIFKFKDNKWIFSWVKQKEHLFSINSLLNDEKSWKETVNSFSDIPSPIFRAIRVNDLNFQTIFPNLIQFDEEYQTPFWLENLFNTKRFSVYITSMMNSARRKIEKIEPIVIKTIEKETDDDIYENEISSSEYSEFSCIENGGVWKQFFLSSNARVELMNLSGIKCINIHPYTLSSVIYSLAWKINKENLLETYHEISKKLKQNTRTNINSNEIDIIVYELKEYLKGNELINIEIRNLFIHFEKICYICEHIVSFKEIRFRHTKILKIENLDNDLVELTFKRSDVSPIQMTSTMMLLKRKYLNIESENYSVSFTNEKCTMLLTKKYFKKIQLTYTPHLLMTKRYGKNSPVTAIFYPLITWQYLYGDDEDIKFAFLTFLNFIKQYSTTRKINSIPKVEIHQYFHYMLRRFPPEHQKGDFVKLFSESYNDLKGLHFGPSTATKKKRKRICGKLEIDFKENVLTGFNEHTLNIYTGLDSFIGIKEGNTAITIGLYCELSSIFQKLESKTRNLFINLSEFLFSFQTLPKEKYIFIKKKIILEELYLFSISEFITNSMFWVIFTRIKYFSSECRISSLTTHSIPQLENFNKISKQKHLKIWKISEDDQKYLKEVRSISINDIHRVFYFFKAAELIIRYPVKFHYGAVSTFCYLPEETSIISAEGVPYRGQIEHFVEFENILPSTCYSRNNPPNLILSKEKKKKIYLLDVFPILEIEKVEGRSISRDNFHNELPPIVDSEINFFQTIILFPISFVDIQ